MRLSHKLVVLAIVVGAFLLIASSALAGTSSVKDGCAGCVPATKTTSSSSSSTSSTHIKVVKTVREKVRQYEKKHNVIVAINIKPGGVASLAGCVDPVAKGWISPGGQFTNSRKDGSNFTDRWQSGRLICNAQRVKIGSDYWMHGTKDNCGNEIWIQVSGPRVIRKVKTVISFPTESSFVSVYNKWITTTKKSKGTSTVNYTCPAPQSKWNMTSINGVVWCVPVAVTPPTPTPTPNPTPIPTTFTATASASASATASASANVNCPSGSTTSTASATASASASGSGSGSASSSVSQADAQNKAQAQAQANAQAQAQANAQAQAQANATSAASAKCTPAPTPVKHYTNLTCQGQEEVTGGGSSVLVCQVSNDNGAQISLNVTVVSNPGNLLVSGIQCSSQNGTPSCQGAGTFEIRLGGVNDTSAPIYSDLQVTATSNGVASSTFDQTFKVDPYCSNFC